MSLSFCPPNGARPADDDVLPLLVAGHVTRDLVGPTRQHRLGGTAAFAAQAASVMGIRSALVTMAPHQFALLDPLAQDPLIELLRVQVEQETTFELSYSAAGRRLALLARAPTLMADHVPQRMRRPNCAYIASVVGECDRGLIESLRAKAVVACAQGWLRDTDAQGRVVPDVHPLIVNPPRNLNAVVFSELDHPDAEALAQHLAGHDIQVALTRAKEGVSLYLPHRIDVPAVAAAEVDPTGAGDVFGLVFGLALAAGMSAIQAARDAAGAAARVVEGPGLGNLSAWVATQHARGRCVGTTPLAC